MKKFFFIFFIGQNLFALSQTEATIRTHYTEVNKQIAESIEHGYEGPLYNNQWVTNKNGRSWPAVGNYSETTDLWYDDTPEHVEEPSTNLKNVLVKVIVSKKASHLITNEEYLFKDGKLLFYYSNEGKEGNQWETRIYFNNKGIMFKSSVKANDKELTAKDFTTEEYKDFKPNAAKVLSESKKYQDLFVKSMI